MVFELQDDAGMINDFIWIFKSMVSLEEFELQTKMEKFELPNIAFAITKYSFYVLKCRFVGISVCLFIYGITWHNNEFKYLYMFP